MRHHGFKYDCTEIKEEDPNVCLYAPKEEYLSKEEERQLVAYSGNPQDEESHLCRQSNSYFPRCANQCISSTDSQVLSKFSDIVCASNSSKRPIFFQN